MSALICVCLIAVGVWAVRAVRNADRKVTEIVARPELPAWPEFLDPEAAHIDAGLTRLEGYANGEGR